MLLVKLTRPKGKVKRQLQKTWKISSTCFGAVLGRNGAEWSCFPVKGVWGVGIGNTPSIFFQSFDSIGCPIGVASQNHWPSIQSTPGNETFFADGWQLE